MERVEMVLGLVVLMGGGLLYVLPSVVAARRQQPDLARIVLRNVWLGWTGFGWLWCLRRAVRSRPPASAAPARGPQCDAPPDWVSGLRREDRAWRGLPVRTVELWDGAPR